MNFKIQELNLTFAQNELGIYLIQMRKLGIQKKDLGPAALPLQLLLSVWLERQERVLPSNNQEKPTQRMCRVLEGAW